MQNLLKYTLLELTEEIKKLGFPGFRAKQIFNSLHKNGIMTIDDIKLIDKPLKEKLKENYFIDYVKPVFTTDSTIYDTHKFLFEVHDEFKKTKYKLETVLISEESRNTVCVSTQVGCNVGCEFCATGKMGFLKNLDPAQIVSQVYQVSKISGKEITNIVFMGMGEPFLNYDNMFKSINILTDDEGLNLSSKRITVSTVGFTGKIRKFADDLMMNENKKMKNVKLALSLHSTDSGIREKIIPTASKNPLKDIYSELSYFYSTTGNKVTYEYIFFGGLNDSEHDISRLTRLSKMIPSNINVIPFHPIHFELDGPLKIFNNIQDKDISLLKTKLNDFIEKLRENKVIVNLRTSSGIDINAACGQLAVLNQGS
ncbi:23S rRNA (adenine(2503)-C(2))-methyltransferase RlmN [soil metagenome]